MIKSELTKYTGGVLQYDLGKTIKDEKFIQTGSLNKPPVVLMTGVSKLKAVHLRKRSTIRENVDNMLKLNPAMQQDFSYRNPEGDQLFQAYYDHINSCKDCKSCDKERLIQRKPRATNVIIHYGGMALLAREIRL